MPEPHRDNIVLVGMRASGKTTLGRRLADRLGRPFVDLDETLAQRASRSADEVLATEGEQAFREREQEVLQWAAGLEHHVIATGGGAVLCEQAFASLASGATVVYLRLPADELVARAAKRPRPPLTQAPLDREVRALLEEREPLYEAVADITIPANGGDPILVLLDRWPRTDGPRRGPRMPADDD